MIWDGKSYPKEEWISPEKTHIQIQKTISSLILKKNI